MKPDYPYSKGNGIDIVYPAQNKKPACLLLLFMPLFLICQLAMAQAPAVPPAQNGLRLNRLETKSKAAGELAPKAGGPTERIEIQSTDDHIDYVVKTYVLKMVNASEVYELIKSSILLEGGKVDRVSPGSLVDANLNELTAKRSYEGDSMLVVTVPEWMIPYLDRTIELLDRPNLESAAFGTGVAYVPIRHRLPSEVAELIAQSSASPSIILRPDDTRQLLYVEDTPSFFQYDLLALKTFDIPPPQIETRVRIYEIDESKSKDVGVDWYAWKKSIKDGDLTFSWEGKGGSYDLDLKSLSAELSFTPLLATEFLNYLVGRGHARVVTDTRLTQINSKLATVQ